MGNGCFWSRFVEKRSAQVLHRGVHPALDGAPVGAEPAHRRRVARGDLPGVRRGRQHPPGRCLVNAVGGTGISKSEVSRICTQLDEDVAAWRSRSLDEIVSHYVFLDATYCKAPGSTSAWCPRPSSSPPA
jgi:hypothetical protein